MNICVSRRPLNHKNSRLAASNFVSTFEPHACVHGYVGFEHCIRLAFLDVTLPGRPCRSPRVPSPHAVSSSCPSVAIAAVKASGTDTDLVAVRQDETFAPVATRKSALVVVTELRIPADDRLKQPRLISFSACPPASQPIKLVLYIHLGSF